MRKFRVTLEISIPEKYINEDKAMFHVTSVVNELALGEFFPECPWEEKKIEAHIKDLNP